MAADKRRARLQELKAKVKENTTAYKAILDANDAAGRLETPDEMKQIKALQDANAPLMEEIGSLSDMIKARGEADATEDTTPQGGPGHSRGGEQRDRAAAAAKAVTTLGELFTTNDTVKAYLEQLGPLTNQKRIDTPRVAVKSFLERFDPQDFIRTLITGTSGGAPPVGDIAGALVFPQYTGIVDQFYQRPLTIRDLITNGQTGTDTLYWVKVLNPTNNAAMVAEATNTTDGNGSGRKPESAMDFTQESTGVKTLAHWIPVTNKALADAAQLRSYIDEFLRYGIDLKLEEEILLGDGTGENFTGILNTDDISVQAFVTDLFVSARKARTKVRIVGRSVPTAYVLHPNDVETLDLSRYGDAGGGQFMYGGPQAYNGKRSLWGLPVIESESIPEGQGLCADFKQAMLWDRQESAISVSNSHNDFFIRNMVAILAEMRAAFAVIRPQAFCSFDTQDPS
jgi:HK97 family phage major capsid protein